MRVMAAVAAAGMRSGATPTTSAEAATAAAATAPACSLPLDHSSPVATSPHLQTLTGSVIIVYNIADSIAAFGSRPSKSGSLTYRSGAVGTEAWPKVQ